MTDIRSAIILAPDESGTLPVFGIPAVRRLVLLALEIGLETIRIVGDVGSLRPLVSDLLSPEAFHPIEDPESLNRVVNRLALSEREPVLVLRAGHVVDRLSLRRLKDAVTGPDLYYIGTDGIGSADNIYVAGPSHLLPLLQALWSADRSNLSRLEPARRVEGAPGLPCVVEKGEGRAKLPEARLMAALAFQTAADDGFIARHFDRRVSRFISERLAHTRVTPNQITLAGVAIGLTGAFLLSRPGYWPQLAGALLFLFCVVVDGVDGEVARLRLQESRFGHYLDVITDNVVHVAVFVGIALGLYHETGDNHYLTSLWFLLGGFGLCAVAVFSCILRRTSEELKQSPKITRLMALLTNRDFAYLVAGFALIHRLNWFLKGAAVGTYLFAVTLWTLTLQEKKGLSPRSIRSEPGRRS